MRDVTIPMYLAPWYENIEDIVFDIPSEYHKLNTYVLDNDNTCVRMFDVMLSTIWEGANRPENIMYVTYNEGCYWVTNGREYAARLSDVSSNFKVVDNILQYIKLHGKNMLCD